MSTGSVRTTGKNMNILELKGIQKRYHLGETVVYALRGVNLTVKRGEFIALLGPSGSGKTTLLNIAGIIDEPDGGEVVINGNKISGQSDAQEAELRNKTIGYIFQTFNLIPVLSAIENVMLPLQIRKGSSDIKNLARRRLQEVGLKDFIHHRPDKLSGGQRQRVAIARALVTEPLIIIADEPTANLDSKTAYEVLGIMKDLNMKEKVTFIFSTHDQRLINMVDRVIHVEDGRISQ